MGVHLKSSQTIQLLKDRRFEMYTLGFFGASLAEKGRSGGALKSANSTINFNDVLRSANLLTWLQFKGSGFGKLSQYAVNNLQKAYQLCKNL